MQGQRDQKWEKTTPNFIKRSLKFCFFLTRFLEELNNLFREKIKNTTVNVATIYLAWSFLFISPFLPFFGDLAAVTSILRPKQQFIRKRGLELEKSEEAQVSLGISSRKSLCALECPEVLWIALRGNGKV